jgi:hypothetical protein
MSLTSRLSMAALQHVEAFESDDQAFMAERFYAYHTFPATGAWRARLTSRSETAAYIGIARHALLRREWISVNVSSDNWFSWHRRSEPLASEVARFKFYVSPHCSDLAGVFAAVVCVFTEEGAASFKVGNGLNGLLRPDKMVGYFPSLAALTRAADALRKLVAGAQVHGVPFSCQLDVAGLLSWGVDPTKPIFMGDPFSPSWRRWVAARLAALFLEGRRLAITDVSSYALGRLGAEGVDVSSWALLDPESTTF